MNDGTIPQYPWAEGDIVYASALNAAIANGGGGGGGSAVVIVSGTPPVNAADNTLWWDSTGTGLFIRYNDGTSTQWVRAENQVGTGGSFLPLSGGTMTGDTNIPSWPVGNSTDPSQPGSPNAVRSMFIAQSATKLDHTYAEWTAVFGNYINSGQPNGQKVTLYAGAVQGPLGGTTWSVNTVTVRNGIPSGVPGGPGGVGSSSPGTPGAIPIANGTIGYEIDFTNWDQDCPPGGAFTVGMYVHNQSTFASLAGIYYDSTPLNAGNNNFAWHSGIIFTGAYTIQDNAILDGSNAAYSYQANGTRSAATFYANDTAPYAFQANGNHSTADFWASDNAPAVLRVSGNHAHVVDFFSATVSGTAWNGPFSAASIDSTPIGSTTPSTGTFTTVSATSSGTTPLINLTTNNAGLNGLQLQGTSQYSIYLNDTAQDGIVIGANHTANDIWVVDNAPVVMRVGGSHASVVDVTGATLTSLGWNGALSATSFVVSAIAGPTIRAGTGAATGTQPSGSLWLRTDGTAGARLYVSAGGGTWTAVASV